MTLAKIINPAAGELCGQEFEVEMIYYGPPDQYFLKTPKGTIRCLETSIDMAAFNAAKRKEAIERLGADVGDKVMVTRQGSGYPTPTGDEAKGWQDVPHTITDLDGDEYVTFDGKWKMFRPDVVKLT